MTASVAGIHFHDHAFSNLIAEIKPLFLEGLFLCLKTQYTKKRRIHLDTPFGIYLKPAITIINYLTGLASFNGNTFASNHDLRGSGVLRVDASAAIYEA